MCSALRFWRSVYFDLSPRGMARPPHDWNANQRRIRRAVPEHPRAAPVNLRGASPRKEKHDGSPTEQRETYALIGSDKVEGTNVYRSNGDKIGSIERIMLDKHSGKVAYAVMSFGGFLGIGHEHYPVPWSLLNYNTKLGGYEVNISDQQLKGAPSYGNDNDWDWEDRKRAQQVYDYYRVPPYWM